MLEIGTGYHAALLTHRLGDQAVCSVDIDPTLVKTAQDRLDPLYYHPTLITRDEAEGLVEHTPFDRIIATCSLRAFPAAWIHQLRPGGITLVHLEGHLGTGKLLTLHRDPDQPRVEIRFCRGGAVSRLGTPAWHEFGLTATPTEHRIWHHDPHNGPQWTLPPDPLTALG